MRVRGWEIRAAVFRWSRTDRLVGIEWTRLLGGYSCRVVLPPFKLGVMAWKPAK